MGIVILCVMIMCAITATAYESEKSVKLTNVASVCGLNETGTEWENSEETTTRTDIISSSDGSVEVKLYIDGVEVSIVGTPIARTESGLTIFYDGSCAEERYEILYFAISQDINSTYTYSENVKQENHESDNDVLKIYMLDKNSSTVDVVFTETFNTGIKYAKSYVQELEVNPTLSAWGVKLFRPVSERTEEVDMPDVCSARLGQTPKYFTCTKTFTYMLESTTHTISWYTISDCSNVSAGQDGDNYYSITVSGKTSSYEYDSDSNSSTMSFLHIENLDLNLTSIKNTAWKAILIRGEAQDISSPSLWDFIDVSAGFSFSLAGIDVSLSIPIDSLFTDSGVELETGVEYNSFQNGVDGKYTRHLKVSMKDNLRLTEIGHYFEVVATLRDYGNESGISDYLKARWDVDVINLHNSEICTHTCSHSVQISIN